LRSGAQQAFLFDSLVAGSGGRQFTSLAGRLNAMAYVAIAATTALGATLADRDYALPFGLAVGAALAAAWLAAGLKEPARPRGERQSMRGTIGAAWHAVRGNRSLLAVIGFAAALWTVSALVHLYAQAVLMERGLAPSQIGIALSATLVVTAIGAWQAGRLSAMRPFRFWLVITAGVVAGSGLLLGGAPVPIAIAGLIAAELFAGAFEPMIAQRVNDAISGAQRATILSLEGFLFSVTMIWAFPLFGWTAERSGWFAAYGLAAIVLVILLALVVGLARERDPLPKAA
jgi:Na+/melibiose symporter-like transporter